ncbi:hypothetical protein EJ08DRAFT_660871 [Tothia fuscella]|uniref:Maintenance of telomere capping protein 1 n=1 Tax=Tothia fuscella TaxID=1048955 RepID=A0A9P4TZ07_9PEZI|nr:hypothetical protein EJ08DRAFT_660871 [Tothia fuscella]
MAQKRALTDEELLAQFEGIGDNGSSAPAKTAPKKAASTAGKVLADDPLAELESLAKAKPVSRPNTPKLSANALNRNRSPVRRDAATTPSSSGSARNSEDKPRSNLAPRKSGESTRSFHQGLTPASEEHADNYYDEREALKTQEPEPQQASGGGWWGSVFATATAVREKAEAAVKEIQKNEEAQKWAEQVRGNVGALKGLVSTGGDLRSRALPTFTSIINTLAPPISQHERLQIHITHDLIGYPSLDPGIYATFSRVMAQVEGGDLLVIQRGSESSQRRASDAGYRGGASGWNDGPWWRDDAKRDIGYVQGLREGTKLTRASAEGYANEFFAAKGGVEEAAKQATQNLSESNPTRSSDIFLAIQAITYEAEGDLFQGPTEQKKEGGLVDEDEKDQVIAFALYLHDPIHGISFSTITQAFPKKWAEWMDAANVLDSDMQLPEEIVDIIQSGGVDPREWVSEWLEEIISLGVGVVAQRYVARRMGVGEGGIGRGKARQEAIDTGAGEAARAGII